MEGTVKWYNNKKGYGFITGEDDNEYFVHFSAIPQGVFIRDNDKVGFEPTETDKGKQAQNVTLIQKGSEMGEAPAEGESEAPAKKTEGDEAPAETPAEEEKPSDSEEF